MLGSLASLANEQDLANGGEPIWLTLKSTEIFAHLAQKSKAS